MIKKNTTFVFILLANIILLVHVVLPHHHHHHVVCIEKSHCQHNEQEHKHDGQDENHQHDGGSSSNCTLKQAFIVSTSQNRNELGFVFYNQHHSLDFTCILPFFKYEGLNSSFQLVELSPQNSSFFSSYINSSHGLRGPPVV